MADMYVGQTTSKKHRQFAGEPMGKKPVTAVAGIGKVCGERLEKAGYGQASNVFGQYLVMNKDKEVFVDWCMTTTSANKKWANDCYNNMKAWDNNFFA